MMCLVAWYRQPIAKKFQSRLTWVDTFCRCINSLPSNKILDLSKFKAFADDKMNETQKLKFAFETVESLWEKEKIMVTSIFSFSTMFSKGYILRVVESRNCAVKG